MPTQSEVIIEAFRALGGEQRVTEIRDWVYARYGQQWKDFYTPMADMVPVSHGGNGSSQVSNEFRVLRRVEPGKYALITE